MIRSGVMGSQAWSFWTQTYFNCRIMPISLENQSEMKVKRKYETNSNQKNCLELLWLLFNCLIIRGKKVKHNSCLLSCTAAGFCFVLPWWQAMKNLPATRETWVWSLGQEDSFEKGMATHSSILFSFFKLIYLFWLETNYFTILWWFLPYIDMHQPQVYMCPPSWTPLSPPSPSHWMRWIKLDRIIQSEVSQKEKHQYSILTCMYGI